MNKINLSTLSNYFAWILKEYKTLLSTQSLIAQLKIVDKIQSKKTGETVFKIQFTGKNICVDLSALELYNDPLIMENFSTFDIKMIVEAAKDDQRLLSDSKPNLYFVNSITFNRENKTRLYALGSTSNNTSFIKKFTATEINENSHILLNLDKENIRDIAFQAGCESERTARDKIQLENPLKE